MTTDIPALEAALQAARDRVESAKDMLACARVEWDASTRAVDIADQDLAYQRAFPGCVSYRLTGKYNLYDSEWELTFANGRKILIWCCCSPLARAETVRKMMAEQEFGA